MKPSSKQGFTLVELLAAFTVTAIIMGLMLSIVGNLLTVNKRSSDSLTAQGQATLILDQLATDLESIVLRNSGDAMIRVAVLESTPDGSTKPDIRGVGETVGGASNYPEQADPNGGFPPISQYFFGRGGVDLTFFTRAPSFADVNPDGESDQTVKAVRYRLVRRGVTNPASDPRQYMLLRGDLWAKTTFDSGYDLINPSYDPTELSSPFEQLNGIDDDLIFASNIVDFGIRFFRLGPDGMREQILFPTGTANGSFFFIGNHTNPNFRYPDVVEVMVRILTPEGEQLIAAIDSGELSANWWETTLKHSRVFTRAVRIPSQPSLIARSSRP